MASLPSNIAGSLLIPGVSWGPGWYTYSVPKTGSVYDYPEESTASGFGYLNAGQAARFVIAMEMWDRLIAPNYIQTDDIARPGGIRIAFTNYADMGDLWGYAFSPPPTGTAPYTNSGHIWISSDLKSGTFETGSYDFMSLLHEIGHALGLGHPHESPGFPSQYDDGLYTLMSYNEGDSVIAWNFAKVGNALQATPVEIFAQSPMVLDIQAIQSLYGADLTTATGNNTYAFAANAILRQTFYDAGGVDTIDVSTHTRGSTIDLTPGSYSSINYYSIADQIAAKQALYGNDPNFNAYITKVLNDPSTYTGKNNLGIAFNTIIENVIGGAGVDHITGNDASNRLDGGAGGDTLLGGNGDDTLIGGAGWDIHIGGNGVDTVQFEFSLASGGAGAFGGGLFIGGAGTLNYVAESEIVVFSDGTVDIRDNDPLVDDLYYYGHHIDVWKAGADADAHYKASGWREGRNPNAWFDTNAYLAAYADAREAANGGMDPVTHYLTIGWKKGYDPSVRFDTSSYLAAYADVAASGANPLVHYLQFGMSQYRENFADGTMLS